MKGIKINDTAAITDDVTWDKFACCLDMRVQKLGTLEEEEAKEEGAKERKEQLRHDVCAVYDELITLYGRNNKLSQMDIYDATRKYVVAGNPDLETDEIARSTKSRPITSELVSAYLEAVGRPIVRDPLR